MVGVDAGASKTVALLADEQGTIRTRALGAGANVHVYGEEGVERTLREVVAALNLPDSVSAACIGIERPKIYVGSWSEWSQRSDQCETGAEGQGVRAAPAQDDEGDEEITITGGL